MAGVHFHHSETKGENRYEVYRANSRQAALAFLRGLEVKDEKLYLVAETPTGALARDLISIYDEGSGETVEAIARQPLPQPAKSMTRCARCGYRVLSGNLPPGRWVQMVTLQSLQERGLGFRCVPCQTLWCACCAPLAEGWPVCGLCHAPLRVFVEGDHFTEARVVVRPSPFPADAVPQELREAFEAAEAKGDHALRSRDLDPGITAWKVILGHAAFHHAPASFRLEALVRIAALFHERFRHRGDLTDLVESISLLRRAAEPGCEIWPESHQIFNNLSISLQDFYAKSSQGADLLAAADAAERAARLVPPGSVLRSVYGANLIRIAADLREHFSKAGQREALEAGVLLLRRGVEEGLVEPERQILARSLLSDLLRAVFFETGSPSSLEAAIGEARQALAIATGAEERALSLNSLANALRVRHRHCQDPGFADQNEAILALEEAVRHAAPISRQQQAASLINLATSLRERYERTGDLGDLEAARQAARQAVDLEPADLLDLAAAWGALGTPLHQLYRFTRDLETLNAAWRACRKAVELTPETSPSLLGHLNDFGSVLRDRYLVTREREDLDAAVAAFRRGSLLAHTGSWELPTLLNNLGACLRELFLLDRVQAVLDEAIAVYQRSVELTSEGDQGLPGFLSNLGIGFAERYERSGDPKDLAAGRDAFRRACVLGSGVALHNMIAISSSWGSWASQRQDWEEAVEAYSHGLAAIELLFAAQILRSDRENWLREAQGLSAAAAYARFRNGDLAEAVVTLEQGRTRLIAETLERRRRDLERLASEGRQDLYQRYKNVAERWAALDSAQVRGAGHDLRAEIRAARDDLRVAIEEIQSIPEYADFFRPTDLVRVRGCLAAPEPGQPDHLALVYLTASAGGGMALVVHAGGIRPLPLDLAERDLIALLVHQKTGSSAPSYLVGQLGHAGLRWALDELLDKMGERLVGPLADALAELRAEGAGATGPVVLIPTGLLALIPLHACRYDRDGTRRALLDDFTVSYAPSCRLLGDCREALHLARRGSPTLLAVGNPLPLPASYQPLPYARAEAEQIAALFPGRTTLLLESAATPEEVERSMAEATYLHFACHGHFSTAQPLDSGLLLSNGRITTRDLLAREGRGGTRMAVLSACQTAVFEFRDLPEESLGLPAAFLQAGAPGVIGSLWSVSDLSTALLITRFYEFHLQGDLANGEGPLRPAEALRRAQLWLRDVRGAALGEILDRHEAMSDRMGIGFGGAAVAFRRLAETPAERPFAHPVFWAPFVFYGL